MNERAAAFHNALRILYNIRRHDLVLSGVVNENWGTPEASARNQMASFDADPLYEALRMPDANFDKLFALIESKQPRSEAIDLLGEMRAAAGYLRNAKIDLETGATKATAIRTIEGGLRRLEAAIDGAAS